MTGSSDSRVRRGDEGQVPLIGYVLLLSLVIASGVGIVVVGSTAMAELRGQANSQNAEFAMREADSRMSQVGFNVNDAHVLDFGQIHGETEVNTNGGMDIVIRNGTESCRGELTFGTIETRARDGNLVAYQAGGVWKTTDGGSVMLSPPNMQYSNGTFNFQLVNVSSTVSGSGDRLKVEKNVETSAAKTQNFQRVFNDPACNPPDNATITIESQFHRAWGDFFRDHFDDGTVTVDETAGTASIYLETAGGSASVGDGNNAVESGANVTATVEVLGTELSGTNGYRTKINGPTTFRLLVNGTTKTPWPDGDVTDAVDPDADDLNDPTRGERFDHTFQRNGGVSVSVLATSYACHGYESTGVTNTYDGDEYDEQRCADVGSEDIEISSTDNSDNLVILQDGEAVPDFSAAGAEQRDLEDILGAKIDDEGRLDLADNEFVFLYELSKENADPDNAGTTGDPDYNDAVVLLTITEEDSVGAPENFAIQVAVNQVVVTRE